MTWGLKPLVVFDMDISEPRVDRGQNRFLSDIDMRQGRSFSSSSSFFFFFFFFYRFDMGFRDPPYSLEPLWITRRSGRSPTYLSQIRNNDLGLDLRNARNHRFGLYIVAGQRFCGLSRISLSIRYQLLSRPFHG